MHAWKLLLIVAIVGSGFAAGYGWKEMRSAPSAHAAAVALPPAPAVAVQEDLILPPPDMKGTMLDETGWMIKGHFEQVAGIKNPTPVEQVHFQAKTEPNEGERPLIKLRFNLSLDLDIPRPLTPRVSAFAPVQRFDLPEPLLMPRCVEERERMTGVVDGPIE